MTGGAVAEDGDVIEVTFTPTYAELLEAARDMHLRGAYYRRSLFYAGVFAVMGAVFFANGRGDLGMAFLVASVLYVASPYWHLPWRIGRLRKRVEAFRSPMTVRIAADRIRSEGAQGGATIERLEAVRRSKNTLLLVVNPETYVMVPKRAFASPELFARAEALANELAA